MAETKDQNGSLYFFRGRIASIFAANQGTWTTTVSVLMVAWHRHLDMEIGRSILDPQSSPEHLF